MTKEEIVAIKETVEQLATLLDASSQEVVECFVGVLINEEEANQIINSPQNKHNPLTFPSLYANMS